MAVTINGDDNNFGQIQVGDIVYAVNSWGVNVQDTISPDFGNISWAVPCGASAGSNCWEVPTLDQYPDDVACQMCWTLTENVGNTFYVRAYPMMIFGSMGGRDTTWGAPKQGCTSKQTSTLASTGRCNNSAVYDMNDPAGAIGLPVRIDQMGTLSFCFDADPQCSGNPNAVENVFIDTYWHYIGSAALWPTGYTPAWGDLNRINENATEMWNLNFKLCLPEGLNADAATGGPNLLLGDPGTYPGGCITIDGRSWEVHVKLEGNPCSRSTVDQSIASHGWPPNDAPANQAVNDCRNCFYYISFVPCGATGIAGGNRGICGGTETCIDYKAFADFVAGQAFKDLIMSPATDMPRDLYDNQGNLIETVPHFPRWIWEQVGEPPFPVDAPGSYVLDGIALGNELWFSEAGQQACACWSGVKFFTDSGEFGKRVNEDDPEPGVTCTTGTSVDVVTASTGGACSPQSIVVNGGAGIVCGVGVNNSLTLLNCCGTVLWTITGPGNVTIANPTSPTTTFSTDTPGTYTITAECCT